MNTVYPYKLPLKFIGLWVINIALLLVVAHTTGLQDFLVRIQIRNLTYLYLGSGAALALLEQELWDKLKGNEEP